MRNEPSLNHTTIPCIIFLIFGLIFTSFSQTDSLYAGRECKLVLYNGITAEGTLGYCAADSVILKTEYTQHKVAVKDIKFVLNPDQDIPSEPQLETVVDETVVNETGTLSPLTASDECDLYLEDRSIMKDIKLMPYNDSLLSAFKEDGKREIPYSQVRKIVFKPVAPFGKGYLIGAGVGFLAGILPVIFSEGGGYFNFGGALLWGLTLSIPCGLVGGVIGLIAAKEEAFLFEKGAEPIKIKRINYIILNHSQTK